MPGATENLKVSRKLAAILAADIAGYSALMGAHEEATVRDLKAHQSVVLPLISEHGGRVIDTAGDGILAEFASVINAVDCAVAIQKAMVERNVGVEEQRRMQYRIGINLGDVIHDDVRVYGDGINIAARLESIAEPGGITISGKVYEEVVGKLLVDFEDAGERSLKNIARPVRVYRVRWVGGPPPTAIRKASVARSLVPQRLLGLLGIGEKGSPTRIVSSANGGTTGRPASRLSIMVFPFRNLSGNPAEDYLADGITEDLTTDLSRMAGSFVIARNTAFTFKGKLSTFGRSAANLGCGMHSLVASGALEIWSASMRSSSTLIQAPTFGRIASMLVGS